GKGCVDNRGLHQPGNVGNQQPPASSIIVMPCATQAARRRPIAGGRAPYELDPGAAPAHDVTTNKWSGEASMKSRLCTAIAIAAGLSISGASAQPTNPIDAFLARAKKAAEFDFTGNLVRI